MTEPEPTSTPDLQATLAAPSDPDRPADDEHPNLWRLHVSGPATSSAFMKLSVPPDDENCLDLTVHMPREALLTIALTILSEIDAHDIRQLGEI